jgi:heme-binding NEAT domain protein
MIHLHDGVRSTIHVCFPFTTIHYSLEYTNVFTFNRTQCYDNNIVTCRVTYETGFGLDLLHLKHSQLESTGNHSAIAILHTFQFTVPHALEFSVFSSRILATDL